MRSRQEASWPLRTSSHRITARGSPEYRAAWLGFRRHGASPDGPRAGPGGATEFLEFFDLVDHTSSAACGSALANASAVWVPDTARSPIFAGSSALAVMIDAGSLAVASVPVTSRNGEVIAMISTHHRRPASWTGAQRLGLERLARTTGRILDGLRPAGHSDA